MCPRFLLIFVFFVFIPLRITIAEQKAPVSTQICPQGQHWVRAYHRRAYIRSDGSRVSATNVTAHCQGDPPSYAKWKDRLKDKPTIIPTWAKMDKRKTWTDEERERVLEALSSLPEILLLDAVQEIFRAEKGKSLNDAQNPASSDYGMIVLYDEAFKEKQNLARILAHELAHEFFRQISDKERVKYALSTGWSEKVDLKTNKRQLVPTRFEAVEEDSFESVTEDFANNLEYLLFDKKTLKKKVPEAVRWFDEKYGDKLKLGKGSSQ